MKDLITRLKILEDAMVIDEDIRFKIESTLDYLLQEGISLNESNGAMLVTHMAMAMARIKRNERVDELSEDEVLDVLKNENYNKANDLLSSIEEMILQNRFDEKERIYMLLHLETVLGGLI